MAGQTEASKLSTGLAEEGAAPLSRQVPLQVLAKRLCVAAIGDPNVQTHWVCPSVGIPKPGCTQVFESAQELGSPSKATIASAAPIGAAGRPIKPGRLLLNGVRRCRWGSYGSRVRGDAVGTRMGPYINCGPIRDNRAIRRAPSGPVVPNQGSEGKPSEPDMA